MDMPWEDRYARLRKQLGTQHPPLYSHELPFKVPSFLREVKPGQYTAQTVSLGLNNRLDPGIDPCKVEFQRCFLKWKTGQLANPALHQITGSANRSNWGQAWDHFIESLHLDDDVQAASRWYDFDNSPVRPIIVKNFLALDALFLVLFLRYSFHKVSLHSRLREDVYRELQSQTVYRLLAEASSGIWRDVFLFENQIPLHILGKVWTLMPDMESISQDTALALFDELLRDVVRDRYLKLLDRVSIEEEKVVSQVVASKSFRECNHLLHCFYDVVCYSPPEDYMSVQIADEKTISPAYTIPSASQLRKVGIRLQADGCSFIYQVNFENNIICRPVLHLPRLCVSDQTESLLRNLAVFEMVSCKQPSESSVGQTTITSFLNLMAKLVQSKADVRLMKKEGIITSCLGSNGEMCVMWNTICKRFSMKQNSLSLEMLTKLTARYEQRPYQLLAECRAKYFARPWLVASWVAGVVLLLLTGFQTAYTVVSFYNVSKCST